MTELQKCLTADEMVVVVQQVVASLVHRTDDAVGRRQHYNNKLGNTSVTGEIYLSPETYQACYLLALTNTIQLQLY